MAYKFTLDTNCLIDVAEERPNAGAIRKLIQAVEDGTAHGALVSSSASELQKSGGFLDSFETFNRRRIALGFQSFEILSAILYWDISFWDIGLWSNEAMAAREELIFSILFPTTIFAVPQDEKSVEFKKWRNRLLDAQAFWSHDHFDYDIFVSGDKNFERLSKADEFRHAIIISPDQIPNYL